jgi:hypothetical protein
LRSSRHLEPDTARVLRSFCLALFVLGLVGAGTELALIGHYENLWQRLPLVLMGTGLAVLGWRALSRGPASLHAFRALMGLFVASGFVGLVQHYRGNAEFELEMYPSLSGTKLFWESITGATPALAPGTMIELGLLGLAYTLRHPAWSRPNDNGDET